METKSQSKERQYISESWLTFPLHFSEYNNSEFLGLGIGFGLERRGLGSRLYLEENGGRRSGFGEEYSGLTSSSAETVCCSGNITMTLDCSEPLILAQRQRVLTGNSHQVLAGSPNPVLPVIQARYCVPTLDCSKGGSIIRISNALSKEN